MHIVALTCCDGRWRHSLSVTGDKYVIFASLYLKNWNSFEFINHLIIQFICNFLLNTDLSD